MCYNFLKEVVYLARTKKKRTKKMIIYLLLRIFVVASLVFQLFQHNYHNVFLCILTLILFMIPSVINKRFQIELPNTLEIIIILFIFSAEILGEVRNFYGTFQHWDTLLHTMNGFLMAAIGLSLVDILNRSEVVNVSLSPIFVCLVAFCFSMTVGVVWEFFEWGCDNVFELDMQKDRIVSKISSVELNPSGENIPLVIDDIKKTTIEGKVNKKAKTYVIKNGYLDVGINDTMKDLLVNCIGAVVFSVIGFFYIQNRDKSKVAKHFVPTRKKTS